MLSFSKNGTRLIVLAVVFVLIGIAYVARPRFAGDSQIISGKEASALSGTNDRFHAIVSQPNTEKSSQGGGPVAREGNTLGLDERYLSSDDYFQFVKDHAAAAYNGNARAQYYIWNALGECSTKIALYRMAGDGNAEKGLQIAMSRLAAAAGSTENARSRHQEEFTRCKGFISQDPFSELPTREGGYPSKYWKERAIAAQDPLALATYATESVSSYDANARGAASEEHSKAVKQTVETALKVAMRSGDPNAYFQLGYLLQNPAIVSDSTDGLAWMLAACQSGYDCSVDNPRVGLGCLEAGACASGSTLMDKLQHDLGSRATARIYSRAEQIRAYLIARDYEALERFTKLRM